MAAFAQFGSDLDAKTQGTLNRGQRIVELFKQTQYQPMYVQLQAAVLWSMQKGYFDPIPVERVKEFQLKLQEFLSTRKEEILNKILAKKQIDEESTRSSRPLSTSLRYFSSNLHGQSSRHPPTHQVD